MYIAYYSYLASTTQPPQFEDGLTTGGRINIITHSSPKHCI